MAQQGDGRITHITGNVGDDPKMYESNGTNVLKISVGVTMNYGDNKETRWVNCSIWEDKQADLVAFAKKEISKGSAIAVEGYLRTDRMYNEKQQFDMRVVRIGLVTWAKRANSGQQQAAPKAEQPATSDDLGAEW